MTPDLSEIVNKSLSEQVLDTLRAAILAGELRPGTLLVETEVAARLGVSRAPLREALRMLSAEGLVEVMPYHGTKVRVLSRADVEELFSLRAALEVFAVQRLMSHTNRSTLVQQLRAHDDALLAATQIGDLSLISNADSAFHRELVVLSGHNLLLANWDSLALRVRQARALLRDQNDGWAEPAQGHDALLAAIAQGDEGRAASELKQHIVAAGRQIAEHWPEPDDPTRS